MSGLRAAGQTGPADKKGIDMGFKWNHSDDIPQSQDTWAERIALRREEQQAARDEGDAEYEAKATARLNNALDNYTRDRNWG